MDKKNHGICNGLSIASLILSTIGFLTGWLGVGVFFDCIGIALGIIAIIIARKENGACGIAVAGVIVGVLGAGLMFLLRGLPIVWQHFNPPASLELP